MTHEKQERIQGQGGAVCRVPIYDEDGVDCGKPLPCPEHGPRPAQGQGGATPGPWHFRRSPQAVWNIIAKREPSDPFDLAVAWVSGDAHGEANAKLIAASPELADALGDVVAELLRSPLDLSLAALLAPGSPLCERVIAASAALRKAGRE